MRKFFISIMMNALLILLAMILSACSGGKSPVEPSPTVSDDNIPGIENPIESNRGVVAVYDAIIDSQAGTFEITPAERTVDYHFPLSKYYPNVLKITGYGFTPNFWADIKLIHPYPGSGIDGYDPRIIAILPANPGVSFNYPIFGVRANNAVLIEPDSYTKQFDNLGGSILGNANPFKAYFKDQPYRVWSSTGVTQETLRWQMNLSGFGGPIVFKLVVDVSTNNPSPPQPIIDNAPEPVEIDATISGGLTADGGDAVIEITLLDWQGTIGIGDVLVEAPDIFDGTKSIPLYISDPINHKYYYRGVITNEKNAPEGDYKLLVRAYDINSNIPIYNEFPYRVEGMIPLDAVDVTPPRWLNFATWDAQIEGNYAYIAGGRELYILDISSPFNPAWVNTVYLPKDAYGVHLSGGYAYVADYDAGLCIIDIDPIESSYLVHTVNTPGNAHGVFVTGNYAYVADGTFGLQIIDITTPESAYIFKTVDTPGTGESARGVSVSGEYAYVADGDLQIIDIDPPESASLVKTVTLTGDARGICISGQNAFVADGDLRIVDITDPLNASLRKTVDTAGANNVYIWDEGLALYALVADGTAGLKIVDVSFIDSAYVYKTVDTPGDAKSVVVSGEYAYIGDFWSGLAIIEIEPPNAAWLVKTLDDAPGEFGCVHVANGYAYATDNVGGLLQIFDIDPLEDISIIVSGGMIGQPNSVFVSGDYAYVASSDGSYPYSRFTILKVSPPGAAIIKSFLLSGSNDVFMQGEYAYIGGNLNIIDIVPPESASIVKTVNLDNGLTGIYVQDGYAYISTNGASYPYYKGFYIVDIDPVDTASIIKTIPTPVGANEIFVADGYAYGAVGSAGLYILDVDPIESASTIKVVDTPGDAQDVHVSGGYAYVADGTAGLGIIHVSPPEEPDFIATIDTPDVAEDVYVEGRYAYVADNKSGLRIIKLW